MIPYPASYSLCIFLAPQWLPLPICQLISRSYSLWVDHPTRWGALYGRSGTMWNDFKYTRWWEPGVGLHLVSMWRILYGKLSSLAAHWLIYSHVGLVHPFNKLILVGAWMAHSFVWIWVGFRLQCGIHLLLAYRGCESRSFQGQQKDQ